MIPDANLGWLFTEVPFAERFAAAAQAGFTAVEMPWPPLAAGEVAARLDEHALTSVLVNVPVGEPGGPFRFGWACDPAQREVFRRTFADALAYAEATATRFVHVLGGLIPEGMEQAQAYAAYRENLGWALEQLSPRTGPALVVEAINRRDSPRFLFAGLRDVVGLVRSIGHPRVRLLFDTFHCGVQLASEAGVRGSSLDASEASAGVRGSSPVLKTSGASAGECLAKVGDVLGHVQLGDAPDRTDPGTGTVDFEEVFTVLRDLEYAGFVGGEYRPVAGTLAGLGWRDRLYVA